MQIKEFQSEENAGENRQISHRESAGAFPFLYSKTDKRKKCKGKFHSNQI